MYSSVLTSSKHTQTYKDSDCITHYGPYTFHPFQKIVILIGTLTGILPSEEIQCCSSF